MLSHFSPFGFDIYIYARSVSDCPVTVPIQDQDVLVLPITAAACMTASSTTALLVLQCGTI